MMKASRATDASSPAEAKRPVPYPGEIGARSCDPTGASTRCTRPPLVFRLSWAILLLGKQPMGLAGHLGHRCPRLRRRPNTAREASSRHSIVLSGAQRRRRTLGHPLCGPGRIAAPRALPTQVSGDSRYNPYAHRLSPFSAVLRRFNGLSVAVTSSSSEFSTRQGRTRAWTKPR